MVPGGMLTLNVSSGVSCLVHVTIRMHTLFTPTIGLCSVITPSLGTFIFKALAVTSYLSVISSSGDRRIDPQNKPTRVCVESPMASPHMLVEV